MTRFAAFTFALALAACRPQPMRTRNDSRAIASAEQAWRETGRSLRYCPTAHFDVIYTRDDAEYRKLCFIKPEAPAAALGASCLNHTWYRVVLRAGQELEPDGEPVIHEMLHLFILCASGGIDADATHARRDVWKANGPGTIQGRAERIYQGDQ